VKHFPSHNKGREPKHHHGHQFGHPSARGGQTTSESGNESASAYGLSAGKVPRVKVDTAGSFENHELQHADYHELTGGSHNSTHGNSQLGEKHQGKY
jgi:hypothetical protein